MIVLNFICYCFICLFDTILTASGNRPEHFTNIEALIGILTLLFIVMFSTLIIFLTKKLIQYIKNKKNSKKRSK